MRGTCFYVDWEFIHNGWVNLKMKTRIKFDLLKNTFLFCGMLTISGCGLIESPENKEINAFIDKVYSDDLGIDKVTEVADAEFIAEKMKEKEAYDLKSQRLENESNLARSNLIRNMYAYSLSGAGIEERYNQENKIRNLMASSLMMKVKSIGVAKDIEKRRLLTLNKKLINQYNFIYSSETLLLLKKSGFPNNDPAKGVVRYDSVMSALQDEPLCYCKNMHSYFRKTKIKLTTPKSATATIVFMNKEQTNYSNEVKLALVKENNNWRIDDIYYADNSNFKNLFIKSPN